MLQNMRKSSEIADNCFQHILNVLKIDMSEQELGHIIVRYLKKNSDGLAFPIIINSSIRSVDIHHIPTQKRINKGDLVMMDYGAVINGYCSDISRTVVMGKATVQQYKLYNLVLSAQHMGLKMVRPNITLETITKKIRKFFGSYSKYFTHSVGHGIKRDIHIRPSYLDNIKVGDFITIEPGLYIPKFGSIRIEDVLLVDKCGIEILNTAPKDLIEIS